VFLTADDPLAIRKAGGAVRRRSFPALTGETVCMKGRVWLNIRVVPPSPRDLAAIEAGQFSPISNRVIGRCWRTYKLDLVSDLLA